MPLHPSDYDRWSPVTAHLAVARWGRTWYVCDRETHGQIGYPFPTAHDAVEYAHYREGATYSPPTEAEMQAGLPGQVRSLEPPPLRSPERDADALDQLASLGIGFGAAVNEDTTECWACASVVPVASLTHGGLCAHCDAARQAGFMSGSVVVSQTYHVRHAAVGRRFPTTCGYCDDEED